MALGLRIPKIPNATLLLRVLIPTDVYRGFPRPFFFLLGDDARTQILWTLQFYIPLSLGTRKISTVENPVIIKH